jgi:pyridoxal phosphate enzyme (YggS family)
MDETAREALLKRHAEVREAVAGAARAAGKRPEEVLLLAVSKTQPLSAVEILAQAGQTDFGESYVQEALEKIETCRRPLRWHFIGGLQTRKAKLVAGRFSLVHSLDSLKLARSLHKRAGELDVVQDVLLQVNLACEAQKCGVAEAEAEALAEAVLGLAHLNLTGLMVLPPYDENPEASRPYFAALRDLRDRLQVRLGRLLPQLSMGMTGDFVPAIEEGATIVRIGTRIFGPRPS